MRQMRFCGFVLVVVALFATTGVQAQDDSLERYIELLRADVRADKVAIITEVMELSKAQADLFWPIQREYETALATLGDRRIALIKEYAEKYGSLTDELASGLSSEWFSLQDDRNKLRKKYFKKVEKQLGALVAARFIQIENAVGLLVDLELAAEIPMLE